MHSADKVLFWDFDGTLAEAKSIWGRSLHGALRDHGCEIALAEVRMWLRTGYTWHRPEAAYPDDTGEKWWENLYQHIEKLLNANNVLQCGREEIYKDFRRRVTDPRSYRLYPDAEETLRACLKRGYRNYILSNNYPELAQVIEQLGLSRYFEGCVVSACLGYEKPRRELFEAALQLAGGPRSAYMIGDNPAADIRGGNAAGLTTVFVHGESCEEADHICPQLRDLPALLR